MKALKVLWNIVWNILLFDLMEIGSIVNNSAESFPSRLSLCFRKVLYILALTTFSI